MPSMIEYLNSYGDRYQIPKRSVAFFRSRKKEPVKNEVMELTKRIKKRRGQTASITQHNASLELGVKMEVIRRVFTDLIKEGVLKQTDRDEFSIE